MPNLVKERFLEELGRRAGALVKLPRSNSLFEIGSGAVRVYIRYSKVHAGEQTFFGLRADDLLQLEGHDSFIVFLWDNQSLPLFLPFGAYEALFHEVEPASDGQYKAQIYITPDTTELYLARLGRFNLEGLFGWSQLATARGSNLMLPELSHWQVQSLVTAIGAAKGYDIWLPPNDRARIDPKIAGEFTCCERLPLPTATVFDILQEIDVVWLRPGSNEICGMFEVEHSTPIYTALLRFNDVHLACPSPNQTFRVVANETRRPLFVRQLNRPTFTASGLNQICTFLEYRNVYEWFQRTRDPAH
ncbi:MAG TPA: hypothetical protein VHQ47_13890 [Phycisphaerae bacterium]|nr:hypothetical protein [Phycisphaerae bacterium]HWB95041.1 hypothetical protein [Bryobacteraceae bacterium]